METFAPPSSATRERSWISSPSSEKGLQLGAIAKRVYRPDLYAAALAPAGAPIPTVDGKREGEHAADWSLPASPAAIPMRADLFCGGAVFDPADIP